MAKRREEIRHAGVVSQITQQTVYVEIEGRSACSECHAKGMCGASESKVKTIEVPNIYGDSVAVGERVEVALRASLGLKAVLISYVIPLIIILILLLTLPIVGVSELISGLLSLLSAAFYYFVIYLFRSKIGRSFNFVIVKTKY